MVVPTPTPQGLAKFAAFFRRFPDYSVRLTKHARDRMAQRRIQLPQIRRVLRTGSLREIEPDMRTGQDKYRVAGRDPDGRDLEVVVTLGPGPRVTVITAIDV